MSEKPILFSAPMVRALLAGTKTQTRRVLRVPADRAIVQDRYPNGLLGWFAEWPHEYGQRRGLTCPYGAPGDRLWVRESCFLLSWDRLNTPWISGADGTGGTHRHTAEPDDPWEPGDPPHVWYAADGDRPDVYGRPDSRSAGWAWERRNSIHMPRWASRITLEVTDVRVERLNDISEDDARAEGVTPLTSIGADQPILDAPRRGRTHGTHPHVLTFAVLWDAINGDRASWASNPWVWAVSFRRIAP